MGWLMGSFDNLDPEFSSRVQALIAASGGQLRPGSGHRTIEQQIQLRKDNGCRDVWTAPASSCRIPTAIPGRSNHNHGLAMDLAGPDGRTLRRDRHPEAFAWLQANMGNFGLHLAVPGEDWHVEMIDGEGAEGMHSAQRRGAIGFDMAWQDEARKPEDELADRLRMVTQMLVGGEPDATAAGLAQGGAEAMVEEVAPELGKDVTMIEGGQKSVRSPRTSRPAGQPGLAPGASPQYNARGGVNQWRDLVVQALQYVGEDPSEANINMTLRRMQQESGGNPTIVNNWDSNARKGTPSIGLMQVIKPTFDAHAGELASRGQTDPFANLVASMRYAKSRYGSLSSAYTRRGGY